MSKRSPRPVFRRTLQALQDENNEDVPALFRESMAVLRQQGLQTRGLFQTKADPRKVQLLERAWDQGRNPLKLAHVQDVVAVADCLLLWLRNLPAPVIPCKLFRSFLRVQHCSSQTEALSQLNYLFQQMAPCEFRLLAQLMELLHEYRAAQSVHGFQSPTLGQIFAPLVLRAQEGPLPLPLPEDVRSAALLVDCLITDFMVVFFPQSQAAPAAATKPPSRAKRAVKHEAAAKAPAGPALQPVGECARAPVPAAKDSWPTKQLRVVVVPPYQDAEVCFMDTEDSFLPASGFEHGWPFRCEGEPPFREHSKLATVPEGLPLTSGDHEDPDLDNLIGALLCGSMETMLFEDDDAAFIARTGSVLSCPSTCCMGATSGENTDTSSIDEEVEVSESPLSSPVTLGRRRPATAPLFVHGTGLPDWIAACR